MGHPSWDIYNLLLPKKQTDEVRDKTRGRWTKNITITTKSLTLNIKEWLGAVEMLLMGVVVVPNVVDVERIMITMTVIMTMTGAPGFAPCFPAASASSTHASTHASATGTPSAVEGIQGWMKERLRHVGRRRAPELEGLEAGIKRCRSRSRSRHWTAISRPCKRRDMYMYIGWSKKERPNRNAWGTFLIKYCCSNIDITNSWCDKGQNILGLKSFYRQTLRKYTMGRKKYMYFFWSPNNQFCHHPRGHVHTRAGNIWSVCEGRIKIIWDFCLLQFFLRASALSSDFLQTVMLKKNSKNNFTINVHNLRQPSR